MTVDDQGGDQSWTYSFPDAVNLAMALGQRAHGVWTAYIASALVISGWVLTRSPAPGSVERWVLTAAVVAGTVTTTVHIVMLHRYLRLVMHEVAAAAAEARFRTKALAVEVAKVRGISPLLAAGVNIMISSLTLVAIWIRHWCR